MAQKQSKGSYLTAPLIVGVRWCTYGNFTGSTGPGNQGGNVPAPGARRHVPLDKY